jgi:DNA-binding CsgD family transcriptional regulator
LAEQVGNLTSKEAKPSPMTSAIGDSVGPISLSRELFKHSVEHGVTSISYHITILFQSFTSTLPHLHFFGDKRFSRHNLPAEHAEALGRAHEFLINLGKPIIMSKYLPGFVQAEPELTNAIIEAARELGVEDQYMVPVYGPHNVHGVISFGYPRKLIWREDTFLQELEAIATSHHLRVVRHYGQSNEEVELSKREKEVLSWIAKGKSNADIADILEISSSSVDTYTRRAFEKMGVHDRVSATVAGLRHRLISID